MLKFKITDHNRGADVKTLEVIKSERQKNDIALPSIEEGVNILDISDELVYKFWVKNLYNIQSGSHLSSISRIATATDIDDGIAHYNHISDVIVKSVSKEDKSLFITINKELPLTIDNIYIDTQYSAIIFDGGKWSISPVTKEWLDEYGEGKDCELLHPNQAAYSIITAIDGNTSNANSIVFYYENNAWETLEMSDDTLEGCLKNDTINFSSFKLYEKDFERKAIELDKKKIYYTRENYITMEMSSPHYFLMPYYEYEYADKEEYEMVMVDSTDYGREKIKSVEYPLIYISFEAINKTTGETTHVKIRKNVRIETDTKLSFIYDIDDEDGVFSREAKVIVENETDYDLENDVPSQRYGTEGDVTEYIEQLNEKLFPYGYEIDNDTGDIALQEGVGGNIFITRDNMMFDEKYSSYTLTYDMSTNVIQIPLSMKFETDMHHNDAINENFAEKTKREMINSIIDMEKDVYVPAIQKKCGSQVNAVYDDCYRIIFNLHFREHRDITSNGNKEEWQCSRDSYWNGTRVLTKEYTINKEIKKKKVIDLKGRVYNYKIQNEEFSKENKYDYFSYYGELPNEPESEGTDGYDNPNTNVSKTPRDYVLDQNYYEVYKDLRDKRNKMTEYQSDALSYLGFKNDDVKYQKSKLKKSFLRISFYDSDNTANQNLLHTSTIFLDSGNLFAKYIKNISDENEYEVTSGFTVKTRDESGNWIDTKPTIKYNRGDVISASQYNKLGAEQKKLCIVSGEPLAVVGNSYSENDSFTVYDKNGVSVNREPMRNTALKNDNRGDFGDAIDDIERLRMSSQIEVTDKFSSKRSSEGFYFYTYKSNNNGVFPSNIYMRVDFNHAGYGRTIPFMMPYICKSEEGLTDKSPGYERYTESPRNNKIKTFDDICYDWSEIDFDKGIEGTSDKNEFLKSEDDIGYGIIKYMKYAYIKWKYRYDKRTQKHIYYLDPDIYGTGVTSDNGYGHNIILNLYEGKVR